MSEQPKWKTTLLGCGLPLELEAARLLVSKGFQVDSDFRFSPTDAAAVKDFKEADIFNFSMAFHPIKIDMIEGASAGIFID